jgi:hypothetical protein
VLPESLVAVAVTKSPLVRAVGKAKVTLSLEVIRTVISSIRVCPSPKPVGMFDAGLEKNWMVKFLLGRLLSLPSTVVLAEVRTGKFWRPLGPCRGLAGRCWARYPVRPGCRY